MKLINVISSKTSSNQQHHRPMTTTLGKSLKRKRTQKLYYFCSYSQLQLISILLSLCANFFLFQYYTFFVFCVIRKNSEYSIDPIVWILQKLLLITLITITTFHNVRSMHILVFFNQYFQVLNGHLKCLFQMPSELITVLLTSSLQTTIYGSINEILTTKRDSKLSSVRHT